MESAQLLRHSRVALWHDLEASFRGEGGLSAGMLGHGAVLGLLVRASSASSLEQHQAFANKLHEHASKVTGPVPVRWTCSVASSQSRITVPPIPGRRS